MVQDGAVKTQSSLFKKGVTLHITRGKSPTFKGYLNQIMLLNNRVEKKHIIVITSMSVSVLGAPYIVSHDNPWFNITSIRVIYPVGKFNLAISTTWSIHIGQIPCHITHLLVNSIVIRKYD